MPIKKAAVDYQRYSKRHQFTNAKKKSAMRTAIKEARNAISAGDAAKVKEALHKAQRVIDRTASDGVIKKNTAARYKTRLANAWRTKSAK